MNNFVQQSVFVGFRRFSFLHILLFITHIAIFSDSNLIENHNFASFSVISTIAKKRSFTERKVIDRKDNNGLKESTETSWF